MHTINLVVTSSLSGGRLIGWGSADKGFGEVGLELVWAPTPSGGYRIARVHTFPVCSSPVCLPAPAPVAVDASLDSVGEGGGHLKPWIWPYGHNGSLITGGEVLPAVGTDPNVYALVQSARQSNGIQRVEALGITHIRKHVSDDLLWTAGIVTGTNSRVAWIRRPYILAGVGEYRDLAVAEGAVLPDGRVVGTMGRWRASIPFAWCASEPHVYCWTSHEWRHAFLYMDRRMYDLNRLIISREKWVIEAVVTGSLVIPAGYAGGPGEAMNAGGDIIAVGYRAVQDKPLLHECRANPLWRKQRHLCILSAMRSPEEALLLSPAN